MLKLKGQTASIGPSLRAYEEDTMCFVDSTRSAETLVSRFTGRADSGYNGASNHWKGHPLLLYITKQSGKCCSTLNMLSNSSSAGCTEHTNTLVFVRFTSMHYYFGSMQSSLHRLPGHNTSTSVHSSIRDVATGAYPGYCSPIDQQHVRARYYASRAHS